MASHLEDAQEEAKTDMTPMIDCVFLLIIFFLCIDFKVLEAKLPAYLPKDRGSQNTDAEPVEQLSIAIVCDNWGDEVVRNKSARRENRTHDAKGRKLAYRLSDHRIHWMVNTRRFDDIDELRRELKKISSDPQRRVPDKKTGGTKVMPVVIEPGVKVTYGDVARTVDVVTNADFTEVNFGGGLGRKETGRR